MPVRGSKPSDALPNPGDVQQVRAGGWCGASKGAVRVQMPVRIPTASVVTGDLPPKYRAFPAPPMRPHGVQRLQERRDSVRVAYGSPSKGGARECDYREALRAVPTGTAGQCCGEGKRDCLSKTVVKFAVHMMNVSVSLNGFTVMVNGLRCCCHPMPGGAVTAGSERQRKVYRVRVT